MRALIRTAAGTPEVLVLPDPHPAAGQVRIRTVGAGINPADLHILDSGRTGLGLGLDLAGIVDEIGPGVRDFAVGTPAAAFQFPHAPHAIAGAAAEYSVVTAADAAVVPAGVDLLDAATVPTNSLTAAQLLSLLSPPEGRRMLVTGAAGGVGGYAVALAAIAGWPVIGLARATDREFVLRAGAEQAITDLSEVSDVDVVFDAAVLAKAALAPVRDHGRYLGIFPSKDPASERGITISSGVVQPDGVTLARMLELTATGALEARRAGTVPLDEAAAVYPKFRAGGTRGRWVITP